MGRELEPVWQLSGGTVLANSTQSAQKELTASSKQVRVCTHHASDTANTAIGLEP